MNKEIISLKIEKQKKEKELKIIKSEIKRLEELEFNKNQTSLFELLKRKNEYK